jgi:hypothetical protein
LHTSLSDVTPARFAAMLADVWPGAKVVAALVALLPSYALAAEDAEPAAVAEVETTRDPHLALGAGGHVAFGTAPEAAVGTRISAEVVTKAWSLGLEGRFDLPASRAITAQREAARTTLVGASFVPCVRARGAWACGVVLGSRMTIDAAGASNAWLFVGLGARFESHFPLPFDFALRLTVEVLAHPLRYTLEAHGHRVFRSSVLSTLFGPTLVHAF